MRDVVTSEMIAGLGITAVLAVVSSFAAFALAVASAVARGSSRRLERVVSTIFVEMFRNIPALILLIIFAFAVPNVFGDELRVRLFFDNAVMDWIGNVLDLPIPYYAIGAVAALALNTGAHLSEVLRGAMQSVPRGRLEMARTLGASRLATTRTVLVPDTLRIAMPAIKNRLVHNLKNTALASFVAVPEFFGRVQAEITRTFEATSLLLTAAVVYLAASALLGAALDWSHRRLLSGVPSGTVTGG